MAVARGLANRLVARVIEHMAGDNQPRRGRQNRNSRLFVASVFPPGRHMRGKQRPEQEQRQHRGAAMDLHQQRRMQPFPEPAGDEKHGERRIEQATERAAQRSHCITTASAPKRAAMTFERFGSSRQGLVSASAVVQSSAITVIP